MFIQQVQDALYFATIISYAQGLAMLHNASTELDMQIPLPEVVRVWRGGCIIRSSCWKYFMLPFKRTPSCPICYWIGEIAQLLQAKKQNMRNVIIHAIHMGYPVAGLMAALSYFDAYRSERLPTNLIQAQRDYFGAHTYQRIDEPGISIRNGNK